jgi:hypothetical protein
MRNDFLSKCFSWLNSAGPSITCSDALSFATTEIGSTTDKVLTIQNKGKSDLNVTDVEVEYDYQVNFSIPGGKSFTIPAGSSYDMTIQFKPSYAIDYDSWVIIHSNAENTPDMKVTLTAKGKEQATGPKVTLSKQSIAFADTYAGSTSNQTLDITNGGTTQLNVTSITVPAKYIDVFTIDQPSFTLAPGAKKTITVTFSPATTGTYSTNMTIASNALSGAAIVALSANATVGVNDNVTASNLMTITASPNPIKSISNIEFSWNGISSEQISIVLIDESGRTVKEIANTGFNPGSYHFNLDSKGLAVGAYHIVAKSQNGTTQLPIVIEK